MACRAEEEEGEDADDHVMWGVLLVEYRHSFSHATMTKTGKPSGIGLCAHTNVGLTWAFLGNADGLGETRKKELVQSGLALGLRDESDVFVVDNP